jgi:predicted nucleic acid-binding protein
MTMTSIDANILLYSFCEASPLHHTANAFVTSLSQRDDVALSEFVLSEFYLHLRNPAVLNEPLLAAEAVAVIQSYRQHPKWRVLGFPPRSRDIHAAMWKAAAAPQFPRRRIYDLRIALSLQAFGVTEFATANVKDYEHTGFARVWNPFAK